MLVRPHDRQPADDRGAVATLQLVLEDERRLTVRNPIRQRGDREFGEVELVLPSIFERRRSLLILLKAPRFFNRQIPLFRLILFKRAYLKSGICGFL